MSEALTIITALFMWALGFMTAMSIWRPRALLLPLVQADRDHWRSVAKLAGERLTVLNEHVRAATPIPRVSLPAPDTTLSPPMGHRADMDWDS